MASFELTTWDKVRKAVSTVNSELAGIIDELNLDKSYKIYRGQYNFGELILKQGCLQIPKGPQQLCSLADSSIDSTIRDDLGYNLGTNPVSLILSGASEIYLPLEEYTIPFAYGILPPGKVLSTWKVLSARQSHGPAFIWNMSSGARSLFMLAKISKSAAHNKLIKTYDIQQGTPKTILDHWKVFKELSIKENFENKWLTDIIFLSKKFFDKLNDPAFLRFKLYLLEQAWEGSNYWRHQFIWNLIFF